MEVNRKPAQSASDFVNDVHNMPAGQDLLLLVWSHGNASYRTVHPEPASRTANHELVRPLDYPDGPRDGARPSGRRPGIFFWSQDRHVRRPFAAAVKLEPRRSK